ncbi:hypothetical protein AAMO2058_000314000 [Amorphochlora amoebiformis]|uniref:Uncharacterized protein n=1 Tax=Amorphochlora amoebiformis TaxID=1561963 RepID=A0A7S0CZ61_9EUKA|mmetsp:Transcript_14948/g.23667  ORF Transcript_14948/g.23667 Transcript_14948/m.23667 type:complete len:197 (+) Transcript_14948:105-695(+)
MFDMAFAVKKGLIAVPLNLIIACLVVAYWRGLWYILDARLFPEDLEKSGWTSIGMAFGCTSVLYLSHLALREANPGTGLSWRVIEALYVHAAAAASVFGWRGAWLLFDVYFYPSDLLASGVGCLTIGIVGLTLLTAMRSTVAPPMVAVYDGVPNKSIDYPELPWWIPLGRSKNQASSLSTEVKANGHMSKKSTESA